VKIRATINHVDEGHNLKPREDAMRPISESSSSMIVDTKAMVAGDFDDNDIWLARINSFTLGSNSRVSQDDAEEILEVLVAPEIEYSTDRAWLCFSCNHGDNL
jgi:hypothetical protein